MYKLAALIGCRITATAVAKAREEDKKNKTSRLPESPHFSGLIILASEANLCPSRTASRVTCWVLSVASEAPGLSPPRAFPRLSSFPTPARWRGPVTPRTSCRAAPAPPPPPSPAKALKGQRGPGAHSPCHSGG